MKKLILLLVISIASLHAGSPAPKMGCTLAQQGKVTFGWATYTESKYAIQGSDEDVKYTPIKKEGHIFAEILVGSTMQSSFESKELNAKILGIQSKKRVGRGPRHGIITMQVELNGITKTIPMVYFYKGGDMLMKSIVDLKDFHLSTSTKYSEFSFGLHVYSIVCAI